jgi:hypothetical protein
MVQSFCKVVPMASGVPLNASDFTARREQGRAFTDNSAPPSRPLLSKYQHPPEPPTHRNQQQQGLQFPLNADIAYRRQLNRQTLGEELKFVGPPTIISPDSLPVKKRSSITLIEKSQQTMHQHPPGDIAALASQVASFQLSPVKVRSLLRLTTITDRLPASSRHFRRHRQHDYRS